MKFYNSNTLTISATDIEKGTRLINGKLVMDSEKKIEDKDKTNDGFTMEIIQQVANELDPMIRVTIDVPSNHKDNKLAVLDLTTNLNKKGGNRIDYEFFEKPTKNPKLILANSALNASTKRTVLTQECLRRLRNTKLELGEEVKNSHLNNFMLKMKNSGYNRNWRVQILDSALKAFDKMVEQDQKGIKPLYRNRSWNLESRKLEKYDKVNNWYKGNKKSEIKYKSILFVPPTPGGELLRELKDREQELNKNNEFRIKIVEKGGMKVEEIMVNKNPFKTEKCTEKWCPLCSGKYGNIKIACNTSNTGYRWICKTCQQKKNKVKVYEGETSRSIRVRSLEHIKAFEAQKSHSMMYKHQMLDHKDEKAEFDLEITGIFKDALSRQANESVRIYSHQGSEILNSKSEFHHPPTARVVVERKKKHDQQ